jgi:hypothetical protein
MKGRDRQRQRRQTRVRTNDKKGNHFIPTALMIAQQNVSSNIHYIWRIYRADGPNKQSNARIRS